MGILGWLKGIYVVLGPRWLLAFGGLIIVGYLLSFSQLRSNQQEVIIRYFSGWEASVARDLLMESRGKLFLESSQFNDVVTKLKNAFEVSPYLGILELHFASVVYPITLQKMDQVIAANYSLPRQNTLSCESPESFSLHSGLMRIAELKYCLNSQKLMRAAFTSPLFLAILLATLGLLNILTVRLKNEALLKLEKEQQEYQKLTAEKMLALERQNVLQARQLAHDIQSPLSALLVVSDLAAQGHLGSKELGVLQSAIERVKDISKALLRKSSGDLKNSSRSPIHNEANTNGPSIGISLKSVLANLIEEFAVRYPKSEFTVVGRDFSGNYEMETHDIYRIVLNLVQNSCQAERSSAILKVRVSFRQRRDDVYVEVVDNGRGIPHDLQDRIFDLGFTRGKSDGNGLGLYTVKQLIESYGGKIEMSSIEGFGTTFGFTLKRKVFPSVGSPAVARTNS